MTSEHSADQAQSGTETAEPNPATPQTQPADPGKLDRIFGRYALGIAPFLVGEALSQAWEVNVGLGWTVFAVLAVVFLVCAVLAGTIVHDDVHGKKFALDLSVATAAALAWGGLSFKINQQEDGLGLLFLTILALLSVGIWLASKMPAACRERRRQGALARMRSVTANHRNLVSVQPASSHRASSDWPRRP